MTQSAFIEIVSLFDAKLKEDPPVSATIVRARSRAIPESCADAVNIYFDSSRPEPAAIFGAPVDWTANTCVECYGRTTDQGSSGDIAVDQLLKKVYERLALDRTLGGKVFDIGEPNIEAEFDAAGAKTGWIRMTYPVQHRTQNSLLELP